jgi:galactokinase
MSSSSALVVAIFQALEAVNRLNERGEYLANIHSAEDLAGYLGCVENGQSYGSLVGDRGVGTFGGSEDHTAILCSRPGHLAEYSFCPVRFQRSVRLPPDCAFVIGVTGVIADKTGSAREKYNRASLSAQAVLQAWRDASGSRARTLAEAVAASLELEEIRRALRTATISGFDSQSLSNRFEQFLLESVTIVPQAVAALERADLPEFGRLVDASQRAAEDLLGNQVPETVELVRSARSLGAYAASAFGAGFGGSVWALVSRGNAATFADSWKDAYQTRFPGQGERSTFFPTAPGPPCTELAAT